METNVLHQGDCLELMKGIPDKSIDMILCDLPYGTTACKWDSVIPVEPLWDQYKRIIKNRSAIILTASQPFSSRLVCSNLEMFKYEWVWDKKRPSFIHSSKVMPLKYHEQILIFSRGFTANGSKSNMLYNPQGLVRVSKEYVISKTMHAKITGGRKNQVGKKAIQEFSNYPRSVLTFKRDKIHLHPTQKPVALFEYLIRTYTNEGDVVLDNCAGSGTTAIACLNTNRQYILMEQEEKYCDVIRERIASHNG